MTDLSRSLVAPGHPLWFSVEFWLLSFLFILCIAAVWFYCYAIYAAVKLFSKPTTIDKTFHSAISILKPICGCDHATYQNLASFCQQDYPEYQIIFGMRDSTDPSHRIVQELVQDFPEVDIEIVVSDRSFGANPKVNNLANAAAKAKHNILLIADSDVRVESSYLHHVVQPFKDTSVGVVTCPYRSIAQGWIAKLETLNIATEFQPGVLTSNQLEGMQFAMGSTILIRQCVLEAIGGFYTIADYLADDFQLGYLPAQLSYKVVLSSHIVSHVVTSNTLSDVLHRQTRWMRGIRFSRPWSYMGLIFTYGTVSSCLFLYLTEFSKLGWIVLSLVWTTRFIMAWCIGVKYFADPIAKKLIWLVPLRDILSFLLWCYSFTSNTVEWRGHRFKLIEDGKLIPLTSADSALSVSTFESSNY